MRALTFLISIAAFGQPVFEAADVRVSPTVKYPYMRGGELVGGHFTARTASLVDLMTKAYGMNDDRIVGGPSWLEMDRYDVIAKAPASAPQDDVKPMLQALLADRFKLKVHNDTKPVAVFALTAGKHPNLKKAEESEDSGCKFLPLTPGGRGAPPVNRMFSFQCHNMTMDKFASGLADMNGSFQYLHELSVVDKTDLKGAFDFTLKFSIRNPNRNATGEIITLFDAIDKQLGLKLEPAKIPLPVIVVDSAERRPSPNAPDVEKTIHIPPVPAEFEVADVKPSNPNRTGMNFDIQPGGNVTMRGMTIRFLIRQLLDLTDEMVIGAPKWIDQDRFDIVAKLPAGTTADFDSLGPPIKALLAERFKLVSHMEERPISAYNLIVVKPKMKKADPNSRTRFAEGPAPDSTKDPRDTNPMLARLVTCQNMTMKELAANLQQIASGYIHTPVLDMTGLEGAFDFTINFSPAGMNRAGGEAPTNGEASDPNGGLTLFEAMEKQLGLKLQAQKRPVQVLVIDHIEQKPTEN